MHIVLAFQFIACSYEIAGSSLRGMGKSMTPTVLTVFEPVCFVLYGFMWSVRIGEDMTYL